MAFGVIAVGVVARDVFESPLLWTEEISRMFLIYIVFLAGSGAIASGTHFRVEFLDLALPPRFAAALSLVFDLATIGLLIFLTYSGTVQTGRDHMVPMLVLQWPSSIASFALPLAALFMIARMGREAVRHLRIVMTGAPPKVVSPADPNPTVGSARGD